MVIITKTKGESKENMFRKFTKIFIDENIIDDVRKKQFYKKPSLIRKEKLKLRQRGGISQIRKNTSKVNLKK